MQSNFSRMSSRSLAKFFLAHAERHTISAELACVYPVSGFIEDDTCSERLYDLIMEFEASDCCDVDLLTEIIEMRRRETYDRQKRDNLLLNQIYRYINENLTDDMKMEDLADSLHVNFNYLCRFFKYHTGMSPNAYKTRKRIEKSIPLLTDTGETITAIARLCGFENSSYFTRQFSKLTGMTPSFFRETFSDNRFSEYFELSDILLAIKLHAVQFLKEPLTELPCTCLQTHVVSELSLENSALAVPCITAYSDTLYALWCLHFPRIPQGLSTVRGKLSRDGGKFWVPLPRLAKDDSGRTHYDPASYGISGGELYLLQSQWFEIPTNSKLEIRKLNVQSGCFLPFRSLPTTFIPSANLMQLPDGSLILPGRTRLQTISDHVPAVLLFESGKLDGEWRIVPMMDTNCLPDGSRLIWPHTDLLYCGDTLYLFCRNDRRRVPLVFLSHDFGKTWGKPMRYDLPYVEGSKPCCGTLSTGENYLISAVEGSDKYYDHSKLCIYFSRKHSMVFDRRLMLFDGGQEPSAPIDYCNQPSAVEQNGKLHVLTIICDETNGTMGTLLCTIDLSVLEDMD